MRNATIGLAILLFGAATIFNINGAQRRDPPPALHASYQYDGKFLLPDPAVTPGATNPDVRQSNIHQTICVRGWSAKVRPPESYTEPLKRKIMEEYGDTIPDPHKKCFLHSANMGCYELDHDMPIEDGGEPGGASRPQGQKNLWPQLLVQARLKDKLENYLHRQVCSGKISLVAAQLEIGNDWSVGYRAMLKKEQSRARR